MTDKQKIKFKHSTTQFCFIKHNVFFELGSTCNVRKQIELGLIWTRGCARDKLIYSKLYFETTQLATSARMSGASTRPDAPRGHLIEITGVV